jgi:hypothetical protein
MDEPESLTLDTVPLSLGEIRALLADRTGGALLE